MNNLEELNNQDAINNIVETLKNKLNEPENKGVNTSYNNNEINGKSKGSESLDINKIIEGIKSSGLMNKEKNNNNNSSAFPDLSGLNLDMSTIMKIQKISSAFNKADPRKNLLSSLKPFLRQTRQKNVDTYINIISILGALGSFSEKG